MHIIITDGTDQRFVSLCQELDEYLNEAVGGEKQRSQYIQYNQLQNIHDVVLILHGEEAVASGSFKEYDSTTVEMKRIFVKKEYRGKKYGQLILTELERIATEKGYTQCILETGSVLTHAAALYRSLGYEVIDNYGQYKDMKESLCMHKML